MRIIRFFLSIKFFNRATPSSKQAFLLKKFQQQVCNKSVADLLLTYINTTTGLHLK